MRCIGKYPQRPVDRFARREDAHKVRVDEHEIRSRLGRAIVLASNSAPEHGKVVFWPKFAPRISFPLFAHSVFVRFALRVAR